MSLRSEGTGYTSTKVVRYTLIRAAPSEEIEKVPTGAAEHRCKSGKLYFCQRSAGIIT